MAAIEYKVLAEILRTKDLTTSIRAGLTPEQFKDPEARAIFKYIQEHFYSSHTRGELPMVEQIRDRWPAFEPSVLRDAEQGNIRTLISMMRGSSMESDIYSELQYLNELQSSGEEARSLVDLAVTRFKNLQNRYSTAGSSAFGVTDLVRYTENAYQGAIDGTTYGVPWPWKCLTDDTLGKKPQEFYVFYGRMKSMKTWVMLKCAADDFAEHGQRVMIWSREMSKKSLMLRLASIFGGVDYQLLKNGRLPKAVRERAFEKLRDMEQAERACQLAAEEGRTYVNINGRDLKVFCGPDAPKSLEELRSRVESEKPEVLYVDSFYHLTTAQAGANTQRWSRVTILAEGLKALALDLDIPVIATAQANREGEKTHGSTMSDIADADAIAREADLVIRVIMKKGHALAEEDYEGDVEYDGAGTQVVEKPIIQTPKKFLIMPPKMHIRRALPKIPDKVAAQERRYAELALVAPGNREGVLDGWLLKVIPGYKFDVIATNIPQNDIEAWVKKDLEEEATEVGAEPGSTKNPNRRGGLKNAEIAVTQDNVRSTAQQFAEDRYY
jgi:replicative DNA helicase